MKININELLEQATKRYESGDFHAWISDLCIDAGEADIEVIVIAAIEHSKKADRDTTTILKAAKELGRIEVLDMLKDYELAYDPLGGWIIDSKKEVRNMDNNSELLEYLDAHREVVV